MYTFSVIRPEPDNWWIVAIRWDDPKLIVPDEDIAVIIGMNVAKMQTELVRYYGAELYEQGGTYWENEFEAKKVIEVFFQPRMVAQQLTES